MKQAAFFVVVPALLLAGLWGLSASGPSKEELVAEMVSDYVAAQNDNTGDEILLAWQNWRLFNRTMDSVVEQLRQRQVTLHEATEHLLSAAKEWAPRYLVGVDCYETGDNRREKVARNLIRHFLSKHEQLHNTALITQLETQFQDMTGKSLDAEAQLH